MDTLWQSPYVNVCKSFTSNLESVGDVQQITDKKIGKTIYRISGQTPSANYIKFPKSGKPPLALVGKYVYVILKTEVGRPYIIHFDLATNDYPLRLSFSNIYKDIKRTTTGITIPMGDFPRWSVIALHLPPIVERYANLHFISIRSIQLCAQTDVFTVITSSNCYQGPNLLPRDVALAARSNRKDSADYTYDWVPFPPLPRAHDSLKIIPAVPTESESIIPSADPTTSSLRNGKGLIMMTKHTGVSKRITKPKKAALGPMPKLTLSRVVGYSGTVKWMESDRSKFVIFAANDVVVIHDVATGLQRFLFGATGKITAISASFPLPHSTIQKVALTPILVAVAQEKPYLIRVYTLPEDFFTNFSSSLVSSCSTARMISVPGPILSLSFASTSSSTDERERERQGEKDREGEREKRGRVILVGTGSDGKGRTLIAAWALWPFYSRICWHISDIHVTSMKVYSGRSGVPVDGSEKDKKTKKRSWEETVRIVTCGRGNVRAWRLKEEANYNSLSMKDPSHHRFSLKGCAIDLGRYQETHFTNIGFEESSHTSHFTSPLRAYVSSTSGLVFQINLDELFVEAIYNLHSNTPVQAVVANEGFCITGGAEGLVRIWPLDFADFLIEAKHDGAVRSLDISTDGLQLVVGTEAASLGTLDIPSRQYHTFLRSHARSVLSISVLSPAKSSLSTPRTLVDPIEIATASEDRTVRIWAMRFPKMDQIFEFSFASDVPICLAAHPSARVVACGFSSGCMRVLDVQTTSTIHEVRQHLGPILSIAYSPDGSRLFSISHDSALVTYDCLGKYLPIHVIPTQNRFPSPWQLSTPFDKSHDYIAYIGDDGQTVTLLNSKSLRPRNIINTPPLRAIHISPMYPKTDVSILCITIDGNLLIYDHDGQLLKQVIISKREPRATIENNAIEDIDEKPKNTECGWVTASSDGRFIATGGDGALFLWDRASSPNMATPPSESGNIPIWPWQVYAAHMPAIYGATFSPENSHLLCVGEGGVITTWSVDNAVSQKITSNKLHTSESSTHQSHSHHHPTSEHFTQSYHESVVSDHGPRST